MTCAKLLLAVVTVGPASPTRSPLISSLPVGVLGGFHSGDCAEHLSRPAWSQKGNTILFTLRDMSSGEPPSIRMVTLGGESRSTIAGVRHASLSSDGRQSS